MIWPSKGSRRSSLRTSPDILRCGSANAREKMEKVTDNQEIARRYLKALEKGKPEDILGFFATDILQEEFPNRLTPQGAVRDLAAMREGAERGRKVMTAQRYEVLNAFSSGDQVALEVQWTGTLAVPFGNLPAGGQMRA